MLPHPLLRLFLPQVGQVLSKCSAVVLKAGKEGQYEQEGYGQRPYDNWETILFDCEGLVSAGWKRKRWTVTSVEIWQRQEGC